MTNVKNLMTYGNTKIQAGIDAVVLTYSQKPGPGGCQNCDKCWGGCYAKRPYLRWLSVKAAWDYNFNLLTNDRKTWFRNIFLQIEETLKSRKVTSGQAKVYVRIHVAGEFISQDNLDLWVGIIKAFPMVTFWTYTKMESILDFEEARTLKNLNIVKSILPNGEINFGSPEYCKDKQAEYKEQGLKLHICPATVANQNKETKGTVHCVKDCTLCMTCPNVLFYKH